MYLSLQEYPSREDRAILASQIISIQYFRSDASTVSLKSGDVFNVYGTVEYLYKTLKTAENMAKSIAGSWLGGFI